MGKELMMTFCPKPVDGTCTRESCKHGVMEHKGAPSRRGECKKCDCEEWKPSPERVAADMQFDHYMAAEGWKYMGSASEDA